MCVCGGVMMERGVIRRLHIDDTVDIHITVYYVEYSEQFPEVHKFHGPNVKRSGPKRRSYRSIAPIHISS